MHLCLIPVHQSGQYRYLYVYFHLTVTNCYCFNPICGCTLSWVASSLQVEAIKTGMCDSMYDTLHTLNQQGLANPLQEKSTEAVSIEVEPFGKQSVAVGRNLTYQHSELDYIYIP